MEKSSDLLIQGQLLHLFLVRGGNHSPQYLVNYGGAAMEALDPRTVPRPGKLPSSGFEEGVAPKYIGSPALVAFLFGSSAEATSFPLGLSAVLPFLLGELEGASLGHFSPITTPLA